jgi:hypothetical protein
MDRKLAGLGCKPHARLGAVRCPQLQLHADSGTVLVLNLLLNCGQRNINFADHAARLELRSRRARKLLREAFFDEKHPSARRFYNERPSLFAPFEMKCTATLIDFRRNIHASVGDCQRPVSARVRTQFIDRHNEGKRCSGINSCRRGLDSELLAVFQGSSRGRQLELIASRIEFPVARACAVRLQQGPKKCAISLHHGRRQTLPLGELKNPDAPRACNEDARLNRSLQ